LANGTAISKSPLTSINAKLTDGDLEITGVNLFSQLASKGKGTYKLSETLNAPLAHEGAELARNFFYF
jgi:hypothetical protein